MAGWVKELMLDYGLGRLSLDQRSDLSTAITTLAHARILTRDTLHMLDMYVSGYTASEIALAFNKTTDIIEDELIRVFQAIEFASGYTDLTFIRRAALHYKNTRLPELSVFLRKHGQRFHVHDVIK